MNEQALNLAQFLVKKLENTPHSARLLVGVAGIPASGKSTFSALLTGFTNDFLNSENSDAKALLIGLDGWHLTRAQLDALPDPWLAHERRGIHWTFDSAGYVAFVSLLRQELDTHTTVIMAPSFDHALKDPVCDDILIHSHHRIVVIEGLYTLLSIAPWNEAGVLLDERWLISADINEAQQRIIKRHITTGITANIQEAMRRAEDNDTPNGLFILANMLEPTNIIKSIHDPALCL